MEAVAAPMSDATSTSVPSGKTEFKGEPVKFVVNFNKKGYDIEFGSDETVNALRLHLMKLTGVPAGLQKIMFKGIPPGFK